MTEIKELLDLGKTIAAGLFEGRTYPWEALDEIKDFIYSLGAELSPEEFDHPEEGVWIAKDAKVFPSAYIGSPCIIDHGAEVRHCAFIRGSAIVGKGAVVAAGAVVISDVQPETVVAGIPARIIKKKDEKAAAKTALVDALREL